MNLRKYDRIARVNRAMETRLTNYTDKLEIQKQRFLSRMMLAQAFLKSEYKKLKDEKFRNQSEKKLIRQDESGKSLDLIGFFSTDGLLHGPGVQDRYSRNKNLRKAERSRSSESITASTSANSCHSLSAKRSAEISHHSISFLNKNETRKSRIQTTSSLKRLSSKTNGDSDKEFASPPNKHSILSDPHSTWHRHTQSEAYISSPTRSSFYQSSASTSERNSASLRHSQKVSAKSQSARLPARRREFTFAKTGNGDARNGDFQQNRNNNTQALPQKSKEKQVLCRSHTTHFIDRLSVMKKQMIEEEAQCLLRLRKENQQTENKNVTIKVWEFIGRRPVSAFRLYREADSTHSTNKRYDEINGNAKLLDYINRSTRSF